MKLKKATSLVIDSGPIIGLVAAMGDLNLLKIIYSDIIVPFEVCKEIEAGGKNKFAVSEFKQATWLDKRNNPSFINNFIVNFLDTGEASVIELAMKENIENVCIDEETGRRFARLAGLKVTGSIGILLAAYKIGIDVNVKKAIKKMREHGVWISKKLEEKVLREIEK